MTDADLLLIQRGLKGLGYDPGPLDGLTGPVTPPPPQPAAPPDRARLAMGKRHD